MSGGLFDTISMLYAPSCCALHEVRMDDDREPDDFDPTNELDRLMVELVAAVHAGRITADDLRGQPAQLYVRLAERLMEGVEEGLQSSTDDLAQSITGELRENIYRFSAAKTFQEIRALVDLLLDDSGQIRPFADFRRDALRLHDTYNRNWLRTEYNMAVRQSSMAAQWERLEAGKEAMPLLRYRTVGDERVRTEHRALDGVVKPIDDAFWSTHYPPNDWGCRCYVEPLFEDEANPTPDRTLADLTDPDRGGYQPEPLFQMNAGKDKYVFRPEHPYFSTAPKAKLDDNFGLPRP